MKKYLRYAVPNFITLLRVVLTGIFTLFLNRKLALDGNDELFTYLVMIFFAICVTDFIDGRIARYFKSVSSFGSFLDVLADFLFILCATGILIKYKLIAWWFLIVIIAKIIDFFVTSKIMNKYKSEKNKTFVFDFMGRAAAISFYIMPFIVLSMNEYLKGRCIFPVLFLTYISTIIALISLFQRIILCIQIKRRQAVKHDGSII
ncbi:CDP-alcohol phosphatidyltransferase family protein [Clostridium autoethanogenum]|uniref:Phosphatidylglycerophosphate synthase n=1 Tax=Clostridium autoethanogenum DSM 10061 TaxID=1341692 RepID=A0ABN4BDL5_9CLOT|nr:CDP-alcohol phosphatidyltransferase family protein [Clostridium autoethanogenum]AGY75611.1 CDP-alcohol phosphatidyltransferase family protein [Clostridium autoethanogenum DSM 10061]ALU35774.1 CDP-alcohol phosphatidyltransferase [Clostridium autoethanogenum DSM 10061]OVY52164.1 putative CDP-diacylglycerol--glycerol-3-phosphate 3-phosphatidyl-transferase 2 [Clostridium autoethanogenum]